MLQIPKEIMIYYKRIKLDLDKLSIYNESKEPLIIVLARIYYQYDELSKDISKNGVSAMSSTGIVKTRPEAALYSVLLDKIRSYNIDLGITIKETIQKPKATKKPTLREILEAKNL